MSHSVFRINSTNVPIAAGAACFSRVRKRKKGSNCNIPCNQCNYNDIIIDSDFKLFDIIRNSGKSLNGGDDKYYHAANII